MEATRGDSTRAGLPGKGAKTNRELALEDPVLRSREGEKQTENYSCRRSRGIISGRGFDSPRLHHFLTHISPCSRRDLRFQGHLRPPAIWRSPPASGGRTMPPTRSGDFREARLPRQGVEADRELRRRVAKEHLGLLRFRADDEGRVGDSAWHGSRASLRWCASGSLHWSDRGRTRGRGGTLPDPPFPRRLPCWWLQTSWATGLQAQGVGGRGFLSR